ncbi:hypothetical protein V1514DRAFT_327527 [Lipomyces japonicus]|uniref:uncharacterized protein n=1 Tax=Lipomyces japonicus TaxID=56871 RepID=UPI0034CDB38B
MAQRIFFVPSNSSQAPSDRRGLLEPAIVAHKVHLSHYVAQLKALEREQQRLAIEQRLLVRQQAQLSAKRDQLTYLIAEEQDLVLRAYKQQQRREAEEAAVLAAALADREAQIARRQRLRYAVYRKQQEESARQDAQLVRILKAVQQQLVDESVENDQRSAFEYQHQHQQQYQHQHQHHEQQSSSPRVEFPSDDEEEETPIKPGTIESVLRQQGIAPHSYYSPYARSQPPSRKRGSRRGSSQINRIQPQHSAKLVPDVNYASAQDILSALFGGDQPPQQQVQENIEQAQSLPQSSLKQFIHPQVTSDSNKEFQDSDVSIPDVDSRGDIASQENKNYNDEKSLSYNELINLLFGPQPEQEARSEPKAEQFAADVPTGKRPPFYYTLSSTGVPTEIAAPVEEPSLLHVISKRIKVLDEKVDEAATKIDSLVQATNDDLSDATRRHNLLQIQLELEKYYSDLDDIKILSTGTEDDSEETKERIQELRIAKHAITTKAVDAADRIDKILSPESYDSDSDAEAYEIVPPPQEIDESYNDFLDSSTKVVDPLGNPVGEPKVSIVNEDNEQFVLEKPSVKDISSASTDSVASLNPSHPVTLESALPYEEKDEVLSQEELNETKVPLELNSIPKVEEPVVNEKFVTEASDKSGHVTLDTNTGEEAEEFLDGEEKSEHQVGLTPPSSGNQSRSRSPVRHVVLEDAEDE